MKEPEIKLFGRKIVLVGGSTAEFSEEDSYGSSNVSRQAAAAAHEDDQVKQVITQEEKAADESQNTQAISELDQNNPNTPSIEEDTMSENHLNQQSETTNPKQKEALKKPDKILPCPRCTSMDTKFCYYNNYNVNQPRHFCKNCQRYWTAGGSIRNVPVGAGRRKNKNSISNCRQITISEANESNGTVLSFGPDSCNQDPAPNKVPKNWDDSSLRSFDSTEDGVKNRNIQEPMMQYVNGYFPWNSAVPVQVPVQAIYPASGWPTPVPMPVPVYPTPYWNCGVPNAWNVQFVPSSTPNSPLGKHSRNGELIKPNPIVIPKTLRIDDPEEAAKSSIWSTLGIKNESVNREAFFKALQPKSDVIKTIVTASSGMTANYAAMSRSDRFQERV